MNYDKMLELNRVKSEQKVQQAFEAIDDMRMAGERISVRALVGRTGLSRGFFYVNPLVRARVEEAVREQAVAYEKIRAKMGQMEREMARMKSENERLEEQNRQLRQNDRRNE